jgi:hypothetical protein
LEDLLAGEEEVACVVIQMEADDVAVQDAVEDF